MRRDSTHIPLEELSSRIDGELTVAAARAVEDHLGACETCRNTATEMSRIDELFRSMDVPELSPHVWHRVAAQFDEVSAAAPRRRWLDRLGLEHLSLATARTVAWSAAGAVLLAAVFIQQWSVRRTEIARLAEIDHARTVLIAQYSGTENPFRLTASNAGHDGNPFNLHQLDPDINPFQASTTR
jgi:anti-sigma factor RsiW